MLINQKVPNCGQSKTLAESLRNNEIGVVLNPGGNASVARFFDKINVCFVHYYNSLVGLVGKHGLDVGVRERGPGGVARRTQENNLDVWMSIDGGSYLDWSQLIGSSFDIQVDLDHRNVVHLSTDRVHAVRGRCYEDF